MSDPHFQPVRSVTAVPPLAGGISPPSQAEEPANLDRGGLALVFASALLWSFGGALGRFLGELDGWTVIFWRSAFAAAFLLAFMLWRDGIAGTLRLVGGMRWPSVLVGCCFATASTSFVIALGFTTVANILLIQAGVPLIAALIGRFLFGESVSPATWAAIAAVLAGVAIMVSESLGGPVSPVGSGLALLIALALAVATVVTRRYAHIRMVPAVWLGTMIAGAVSATLAGGFAITAGEGVVLFAFGALNLGLGLALFVTGARLVPAALAALIGTAEPVLGPVWVWLIHGEVPSARTLVGGAFVLAALVAHILWQVSQPRRLRAMPPAG